MKKGIVISCFDKTGNMVKPWADAGYECHCVDIQHKPGDQRCGNITWTGADMLEWLPPLTKVAAAFFFPPFTDVAVSGARWFKDKGLGALIMSLRLFEASVKIAERSGAPYLIENPVSTVSTYWRKPDHSFQPWMYGDLTSKKTCLWTGNGFKMPVPIHITKPEGVVDKVWLMPPSEDRADKRSATSMEFAKAVFQANHVINQIESEII